MKCGTFWLAVIAALLMLSVESSFAAQTGTITGQNTLIRSRPTRFSSVVTKLNAGETVSVLEELTLDNPARNDELRWYKIVYPTNATAWISGLFIDTNLNTVAASRLNVRAGASEFYPIVARLDQGATVSPVGAKGDWIEIVPPANAVAYVAASLVELKPESEPAIVEPTPTEPTPAEPVAAIPPEQAVPPEQVQPEQAVTQEVATVTEPPDMAQPAEPIETPVAPAPTPAAAAIPAKVVIEDAPPSEATTSETVEAAESIPPPKPRKVTREGIVSGLTSIQAPSYFKLENVDSGRIMDYLYSPSTNLVLRRYEGYRVLVQGEESLDARWPTTPVLTIQKIKVVKE